jgi:hypothetical protein
MKSLLNVLLIFFSGTAGLYAQDSYDLLKSLEMFYNPHQFISVNAVIGYDDTLTETMESDTLIVRMQMQAGDIHYIMRDQEFLLNDKYSIAVDHSRKLIFVNNNETHATLPCSLLQVQDAVKSKEASVHSLGVHSLMKGYRVEFATLPVKSMDFWFDSKLGVLNRIEILYRSQNWGAAGYGPYVTIRYEGYMVEKKSALADVFMETQFVMKKNNDLIASPGFKGYRVIDHTNW